MRSSLRLLLLASSIGGVALVQACSGDDNVTTGDGGPDATADTTLDVAPPNDAAQDSGATDSASDTGTGGDSGSDTGTATGLQYKCGTSTVSDCASCTGKTQSCVYCGLLDASALEGVCVAQGTPCLGGAVTTFTDCSCTTAADCPEAFQVCVGPGKNTVCQTCGDNGGTGGQKCKSGGTCDAVDGGC